MIHDSSEKENRTIAYLLILWLKFILCFLFLVWFLFLLLQLWVKIAFHSKLSFLHMDLLSLVFRVV